MFNTPLTKLDYQYLGFYFVLALTGVSIYLRIDFVTGFLTGVGMNQVRHLYRNSNKEDKPVSL